MTDPGTGTVRRTRKPPTRRDRCNLLWVAHSRPVVRVPPSRVPREDHRRRSACSNEAHSAGVIASRLLVSKYWTGFRPIGARATASSSRTGSRGRSTIPLRAHVIEHLIESECRSRTYTAPMETWRRLIWVA